MIEEKCICGHKARFHGGPFLRADEYLDGKPKKWVPFSLYPRILHCRETSYWKLGPCKCLNLKIDNLTYIEDLAKERKLI